jgi:hypothetical protein
MAEAVTCGEGVKGKFNHLKCIDLKQLFKNLKYYTFVVTAVCCCDLVALSCASGVVWPLFLQKVIACRMLVEALVKFDTTRMSHRTQYALPMNSAMP